MRVRATFAVSDPESNATAGDRTRCTCRTPPGSRPRSPKDLTARVFAGGDHPHPGAADGDRRRRRRRDAARPGPPPAKGRSAPGADWMEYEACRASSAPTPSPTRSRTGSGSARWRPSGSASRAAQGAAQVVARDDHVTVRPGQSVEVRVLANDVDNSGGELTLDPVLRRPTTCRRPWTAAGSSCGRRRPPARSRSTTRRATLRGGQDTAVLTVRGRPATPRSRRRSPATSWCPPAETLNATSVEVDVLEVAENPSGPLSDLRVSVDPSAADVAQGDPERHGRRDARARTREPCRTC